MTPREAGRLQGFPDSFVIPVSDNQAYQQFGNSVAVNVIEKLAEQMLIHINPKREDKKPCLQNRVDNMVTKMLL